MDWIYNLMKENNTKPTDLTELNETLKQINMSLQRISLELNQLKFGINPIWK